MYLTGKTEAWDSSFYWMITYPIAIVASGTLGYLFPDKPWRWGLLIMLVQPVVMVITASGFGLLPLGLILFGILSIPAVLISTALAGLSKRQTNLR